MQFTMEQLQIMRQPGMHTSHETQAPAPALYSHGDRRDFATRGVRALLWNPVEQYAHLPQLHACVRCIRCGAKPVKDGISKPRRVYGLHASKLVSAQKYRHPNCPAASGKAVTYDAKHPEVTARLPPFLAAQLSITFTHCGAMDDDMLQHIHHDVMKGLSIQAACDRAVTFLRRNHNQAELDYISLWTYLQQPGTQTLLDRPTPSGAPPPFGDFGSAGHSKPYISCSQYGAGVWLEKYRPLAAFAFLYIASCLGDFLCGDHTFRIAKYIRNTDGSQSYFALFSIRNEYMHIVAYFFTQPTSLVELQEGLQKLQKRYEAAGSKVWSLGSQGFKPALCCDMITPKATNKMTQLVPFQNMSSRLGTIHCSAMDSPIATRLCKGNDSLSYVKTVTFSA